MDSSPTLHDFVLNLLCDATARSAFELDPEGALQAAGLGDITAADVQEVIPLVVDYAPVEGITTLAPVDQLTAGVPEVDVAGAVRQLQAITDQVPLGITHPTVDLSTTVASAVTFAGGELLTDPLGAVAGLDLAGVVPLPAQVGAAAGLSVDADPAASLDADLATPVGGGVTGVVAGTDQLVADTAVGGVFGTLDVAVNTVTGVGAGTGLLDLDGSGLLPDTSSVVGSVVGPQGVVDGTVGQVVDVNGALSGVTHTVSGVGGLLGGEQPADTDASAHGVTDLLF